MLTLVVVFGSMTAQSQTIMLNTGLVGTTGSTLIPLNSPDDNWQVTADPINTNVPRSAVVVSKVASSQIQWVSPLPNSYWISPASNRYMVALTGTARRTFTYRFCFTLPPVLLTANLTLQLRADDIIRQVRLNGSPIWNNPHSNAVASSSEPGTFLGTPLSITYQSLTGFQGGQNCLEVVTEDVKQVITGLNVAGTVSYQAGCAVSGQIVDTDLSTGTQGNPPFGLSGWTVDPKWSLVSSPGKGTSVAYVKKWTYPLVLNSTQPAKWIFRDYTNEQQGSLGDDPGLYTYRVQFNWDTTKYSSMSLTLRYSADNVATVKLNGTVVSSCNVTTKDCFRAWRPSVAGMSVLAPFSNGLNTLEVAVTNNWPPNQKSGTGLIVDATLHATCK